MVSFPFCKINLGLNIISRRPDGFHDIETCFYPVPWTDILEIIPALKNKLDITGIAIPGESTDNLCWRAYQLVKNDFDLPSVHMHLHKLLPTGAGLGGGSSDAAFTLRTINELFELNLTNEKLAEYSARLGSDCAFFIQDNPMIGSGRGEILNQTKLSLKEKFIVLVKPDIHVSTAEAYAGVTPRKPLKSVKEIIENNSLEKWKNLLINDFETSVFEKFPTIKEIKNKLYQAGAVYASMSGSGSSVFGIFNQAIDLSADFRGMKYWSGKL